MASRVEFFVSCTKLPKLDVTSESDPFVVAYHCVRGQWLELGRSEVLKNSPNPRFSKQFVIDYRFEEVQPLRFVLWDFDGKGSSHDFIGSIETTLGRVMGSRGCTFTAPLLNPRMPHLPATCTIRGAEVSEVRDTLRVQWKAASLDKKDFFGSSDPFLVISRIRPDGSTMKVWESPVVKNNLNPSWAPLEIPIQLICNGDLHAPISLEVFDWNSSGKHEIIGGAQLTVDAILRASAAGSSIPMINPAKAAKKKSYTNSGTVMPVQAVVVKRPSLLQYIRGGMQMHLMVAVDFTGSNGDPRNPSSLHFMNPQSPNEYLQALTAVGSILLEYDQSKQVPFFGFGGAIANKVNHSFAINFNEAQPYVPGIEGMVGAYKNAFSHVGLSGPTYFAPTIRRAAAIAAQYAEAPGPLPGVPSQHYSVLLLLTDGQMNDADATVDAIVDASGLPLSVVIVGVGNADFGAMTMLDSDDKALRSISGKTAQRDIVQFVPFRAFNSVQAGNGPGSMLAQEVLREIPEQVTSFFTARGVMPNAPLQGHVPTGVSSAMIPPSACIPEAHVPSAAAAMQQHASASAGPVMHVAAVPCSPAEAAVVATATAVPCAPVVAVAPPPVPR